MSGQTPTEFVLTEVLEALVLVHRTFGPHENWAPNSEKAIALRTLHEKQSLVRSELRKMRATR